VILALHLKGGGEIRLQKIGVGYFQVVYTNLKGETIQSPLFQEREAAVKWAILIAASKAGF
jgi:hypothetical protein